MKNFALTLTLALLVFGIVSVADADQIDFELGSDNSIVYDTTKLTIDYETSSGLPGATFTLEEEGAYTFNYATINSIETLVDETAYSITAYLSFVLPEEIKVGNGGSVEKKIEVRGMGRMHNKTEYFEINFEPVDVVFDTNGLFTVELSDLYAYQVPDSGCGSGGCCCYYPKGDGTITATVTLRKSPVAVPEPSTFILFGTVLAGALGVKRIKG